MEVRWTLAGCLRLSGVQGGTPGLWLLKEESQQPKVVLCFLRAVFALLAASLQQGLLAAEERDKMALTREPTASPKSKTSVSTGEEAKDSKLVLLFSYT